MATTNDEAMTSALGGHRMLLEELHVSLSAGKTELPKAKADIADAVRNVSVVADRVAHHRQAAELQDGIMRSNAQREHRQLAATLLGLKIAFVFRIIGLYSAFVLLVFVLFLIRYRKVLAIAVAVAGLAIAAIVYGPLVLAEINRLIDLVSDSLTSTNTEPAPANRTPTEARS